ncbi:GDCCVxC domain-containing (seleno)protein [Dyadobacter sp. LHD-138]|uniref:GDCCVxC domain-containing (seleno)protein n=1 Tax=Dyadobacter sp. LHD-138 TaxID=3071413 RepID=UPI0027E09602|nr:GDCCVxC domain-containing (seleno)protein [Dyadobacter sp. LHD-138]MDQ6482551.1 GDCCVxC domain-containing (seleno)protein [Dyadobacter sp. LHD-138]
MNLILESVITCPHCGAEHEETMPVNACVYFYECTNCKTLLKPAAGDCCVFCTYGTRKCPPIQLNRSCC